MSFPSFHSFSSLAEAMKTAEFYPQRPATVDIKETHISCVFLAGDYVYKIRKPVCLPFVDCSTLAKRRLLCVGEMDLNRRLSPDVYLGVVPIILRNGRYALSDESHDMDSDVIDFAVKMRRLPDTRRLDRMIETGGVTLGDVGAIAERIAAFRRVTTDNQAWTYGSAAAVWQLIIGNLSEAEGLVGDTPTGAKLKAIENYSCNFVSTHWELLNKRARSGYVREGHGDLRADSIYLTADGIRIIDCLEFSEQLRCCDAASEVAFLAMDLDRLGKPDLAEEFMRSYASATVDPDIGILMAFYKCYRATIRAKVDLIRSNQKEFAVEERISARESARRYLDQACSYAESAHKLALVIVCGPSGTGKSTLAQMLYRRIQYKMLSSDLERKILAGLSPNARVTEAYGEGIYSKDFTRRVYQTLIEKAEGFIRQGEGVILDATFRHKSERALVMDLAKRFGLSPYFIECRADQTEVIRRLLERRARINEISDATVAVYQAQLNDFEALDEIPGVLHIVADTNSALSDILVEVERRIRIQSDVRE